MVTRAYALSSARTQLEIQLIRSVCTDSRALYKLKDLLNTTYFALISTLYTLKRCPLKKNSPVSTPSGELKLIF